MSGIVPGLRIKIIVNIFTFVSIDSNIVSISYLIEDKVTFQTYFTPVVLGFIGGVTPGPILILAFSDFLNSSSHKLQALKIVLTVVFTETIIALFLIITSRSLRIPDFAFHLISILGITILISLMVKMFKVNDISYSSERKNLSLVKIFFLMLFNGPLWVFWITICLPVVNEFGKMLVYGEYLYLIIFETSMIIGIVFMFILFIRLTRSVRSQNNIKKLYYFLGCILGVLILKMVVNEGKYFINYLKALRSQLYCHLDLTL